MSIEKHLNKKTNLKVARVRALENEIIFIDISLLGPTVRQCLCTGTADEEYHKSGRYEQNDRLTAEHGGKWVMLRTKDGDASIQCLIEREFEQQEKGQIV